jgi:hypothetical protein
MEERLLVHFFVKDREPTIASIEDMIKLASQRHSQRSSHRLQVIAKGSAWQEKKGPDTFSHRSFPREYFHVLGRMQGVQLYSLQKGADADQLADFSRVGFP